MSLCIILCGSSLPASGFYGYFRTGSKHRHRFCSKSSFGEELLCHVSFAAFGQHPKPKNISHIDMQNIRKLRNEGPNETRASSAPLSRLFSLGAQEGRPPSSPGHFDTGDSWVATGIPGLLRGFLGCYGDSWVATHNHQPNFDIKNHLGLRYGNG